MKQTVLDVRIKPKSHELEFIKSNSNEEAYNLVNSWPNWQGNAILICGDRQSGKTLLSKVWQDKSNATIVTAEDIYNKTIPQIIDSSNCFILEDIEKIKDEVALFHFFNAIREENKYLLMTASRFPQNIGISLPDLRSRINSIPSAFLDKPDFDLLKIFYKKQFTHRQLKVKEEVINFLILRAERSCEEIVNIVNLLDEQSLIEKKGITIPFARKVLNISADFENIE